MWCGAISAQGLIGALRLYAEAFCARRSDLSRSNVQGADFTNAILDKAMQQVC